MKHCACAILVRDGCVLLGKRAPHRKQAPNRWDVMGGHVEPGETLEQALIREVQEEIGLTPTRFARIASIPEPDPQANGPATYHVYVVQEWTGGEPIMLGDEHTALQWFSTAEASLKTDLALEEYRSLFQSINSH
jgi:8-oxo-dGTP diphosphatase